MKFFVANVCQISKHKLFRYPWKHFDVYTYLMDNGWIVLSYPTEL